MLAESVQKSCIYSCEVDDPSALYRCYMPAIDGGGLFLPTDKRHEPGDKVFIVLQWFDQPTRLAWLSTVIWITPARAQTERLQGIGVSLVHEIQEKIESHLGLSDSKDQSRYTL